MTKEHLHILQHTLGCDEYGRGTMYRNHFVTDPESRDGKLCLELVSLELMRDHGPQSIAGGMHCFCVTDMGKTAMYMNSPSPPKLSRSKRRYQEYLKVADCFESFGAWLKYKTHA